MDALISSSGSLSWPRLLDLLRVSIRLDHYSLRAGQAYVDWIRRFIRRLGKRRPREMGAVEVAQRRGQIVALPSAVQPAGRKPGLRSP
jgi:hypothetical protein